MALLSKNLTVGLWYLLIFKDQRVILSLFVSQVKEFVQKFNSCQPSPNDSPEGEIPAFLIDEGQLHTYDDLTKVNPVTPATGNQ